MLLPSSFTLVSPPKTKLQQANKLERKWNDMWYDIWYGTAQLCMKGYILDIGYKSLPSKATCNKEILKIRRLL